MILCLPARLPAHNESDRQFKCLDDMIAPPSAPTINTNITFSNPQSKKPTLQCLIGVFVKHCIKWWGRPWRQSGQIKRNVKGRSRHTVCDCVNRSIDWGPAALDFDLSTCGWDCVLRVCMCVCEAPPLAGVCQEETHDVKSAPRQSDKSLVQLMLINFVALGM